MRKIVLLLIFVFSTTVSISGVADMAMPNFTPIDSSVHPLDYSLIDVRGTSCRRFPDSPEWNVFLIPDGTFWQGLEPATCAEINSAAPNAARPGEVWASGAGGMRCLYGVTYLYGNTFRLVDLPASTPPEERPTIRPGVRGTLSPAASLALLQRCLAFVDDQPRGCLENCTSTTGFNEGPENPMSE